MTTIILASNNKDKVKEVKEILKDIMLSLLRMLELTLMWRKMALHLKKMR